MIDVLYLLFKEAERYEATWENGMGFEFCGEIYVAIREAYVINNIRLIKDIIKNEKVDFISAPAYPFRQLRS